MHVSKYLPAQDLHIKIEQILLSQKKTNLI